MFDCQGRVYLARQEENNKVFPLWSSAITPGLGEASHLTQIISWNVAGCDAKLQDTQWKLNFLIDGSVLEAFVNGFFNWSIVEGKGRLDFILMDLIVIDENGDDDIIKGKAGVVNLTIAVVAVAMKTVIDEMLVAGVVDKNEIFAV
ncbi:hypothetical protein NDU88_005206 [Pleurodeles waltl]|uniref:Uncharacterized protein n=1 Tax=Pleurodeles waltl TaxID=8319 RepID=A0AAV7L1P4_PLEWA|nr:hypothetical protein NDU88_005206 [Pleurodeles waltl]